MTIKIATVFSGIGAAEQALKRLNLNHEIAFACDIDKYVKQTYFANYDISSDKWYDDIFEIDGKKYKNKIDLLIGGSPCQSFSMVGKRKGLEDNRGMLVYEFIRLIDEIKPKIFIFENVKGILTHDKGETWKKLKKEFINSGYSLSHQVLNAKNYGIPQNRERLFVVGFLKEKKFEFPKPLELKITMQDLLEDLPLIKYFLPEKGIKFVTNENKLKKKYTQINGDIAICQKANQQFNWHGDFVTQDINRYYLSDKIQKYVMSEGTKNFKSKPKTDLLIARPLLSTMAKMHRAGVDNYVTRNNRLRKLTPRECLRLMGFPDSFKIVVSDTQMYKQTGNSIVVDVLVNIFMNMYEGTKNEIWK